MKNSQRHINKIFFFSGVLGVLLECGPSPPKVVVGETLGILPVIDGHLSANVDGDISQISVLMGKWEIVKLRAAKDKWVVSSIQAIEGCFALGFGISFETKESVYLKFTHFIYYEWTAVKCCV